jgi:hypothetical protein
LDRTEGGQHPGHAGSSEGDEAHRDGKGEEGVTDDLIPSRPPEIDDAEEEADAE